MPGMNLAQSAQQKGGKMSGIGRGLIFLVTIAGVMAAIWGGLLFYEGQLSRGISDAGTRINQVRTDMTQSKVDAVTDFQFRIESVAKNITAVWKNSTEVSDLLGSVESNILPGIALSRYSFNADQRTVEMAGEADSFRAVVQQMTVFKKMPGLNSLSVSKLERNSAGRIDFSFSMNFGK